MKKSVNLISTWKKNKQERTRLNNPLILILVTILIPYLIMTRFSREDLLGRELALLIALSIPLSIGLYKFVKKGKMDLFAVIGLINIVFTGIILTGVFGFLKANTLMFAIKESIPPVLLAISFLLSAKTDNSIVTAMIINNKSVNLEFIENELNHKALHPQFNKIIARMNLFFVVAFALSAVVDFALAFVILQSPPHSIQFLKELGRLNLISALVIILPMVIISIMAMLYFLFATAKLIGCSVEDIANKS